MAPTRKSPLDLVLRVFTSLQLTIVCLALGMFLIFVGTIAQVRLGIDQAVDTYFRSFVVWWSPEGAAWRVPIFPGGFLIGGVLLINLIAAHLYRFRLSWDKAGILLTHTGLIVLLLGEVFTAAFAHETYLRLDEGETRTYTEDYREVELAVIDRSDPQTDRVVAIAESGLEEGAVIQAAGLPFRVEVRGYFPNGMIASRTPQSERWEAPSATVGLGTQYTAREMRRSGRSDQRDTSIAWVELVGTGGPLGTWMTSNVFEQAQPFSYAGRSYTIELRPRRVYKPYSVRLLDFTHEIYPGTQIPHSFSSRVRLVDAAAREDREVLIYMNHPLRYGGQTFYQSGYEGETTTILQVVRNPGSTLPYISCVVVGLGLVVQFGFHLVRFFRRRAAAAAVAPAT